MGVTAVTPVACQRRQFERKDRDGTRVVRRKKPFPRRRHAKRRKAARGSVFPLGGR